MGVAGHVDPRVDSNLGLGFIGIINATQFGLIG